MLVGLLCSIYNLLGVCIVHPVFISTECKCAVMHAHHIKSAHSRKRTNNTNTLVHE